MNRVTTTYLGESCNSVIYASWITIKRLSLCAHLYLRAIQDIRKEPHT